MPDEKRRGCNDRGVTLIELVAVLAIVGILLAIAAPQIAGHLRHMHISSCAKKLVADIMHARSAAQNGGRRAELVITEDGAPHDLNGDGGGELWMTFADSYPGANGSYDAGEAVLSCSSCGKNVIIENMGNRLPSCANGPIGVPNRCMWFSTLGTLQSAAVNTNIVFTDQSDNSFKVRVSILSLIGYVQLQSCQVTGTVDCSQDNQWRNL